MKRLLFFLAVIIIFTGCEDYLDKVQDSDGMQGDEVFTEFSNFRSFQDRMYQDLLNYLSAGDYSYIAAVSDEGYMSSDWETLPVIQNGDYLRAYNTAQALQFNWDGVWGSWESIRIINISLENIDLLEDATATQIDRLKGQAHFMRAWYYYEFLKRQGAMPYITHSFSASDNFALPRPSYHETAMNIVADLDTAATMLPSEWDNANIGRPTKGAAMALKASTLLFDASPNNNPGNDQSKWEAAAKASWDLIEYANEGWYSLVPSSGTDEVKYLTPEGEKSIQYASGFDSIFMYEPTNKEIIWENYAASRLTDTWNVFSVPSLAPGGVIQGFSPSANIVDMFETKNGLAIGDDAGYDPQNPYVNRDPRFYHSILFNQERWTSQTGNYMELFEGGQERTGQPHYSFTGYLARKFWGKNIDQWSGATAPITHVIYFRLADILLQYAEAANEIGGPDYSVPGASLTALDAVNQVRDRVNMPGVDTQYLTNKSTFRERIKNERAVELYLEGKRYFDLKRWGDASKLKHKAIYGMDITEDSSRPTGYYLSKSSEPVFTLTFGDKHYRWPIPLEDATIFPEFNQNPGW